MCPWHQTIGAELVVKPVSIPETDTLLEFYLFDCGGQTVFNQRDYGTKYVRTVVEPGGVRRVADGPLGPQPL